MTKPNCYPFSVLCRKCLAGPYSNPEFGGADGIHYRTSYGRLQRAAKAGCPLCQVVLYEINFQYPDVFRNLSAGTMLEAKLFVEQIADDLLLREMSHKNDEEHDWHKNLGSLQVEVSFRNKTRVFFSSSDPRTTYYKKLVVLAVRGGQTPCSCLVTIES